MLIVWESSLKAKVQLPIPRTMNISTAQTSAGGSALARIRYSHEETCRWGGLTTRFRSCSKPQPALGQAWLFLMSLILLANGLSLAAAEKKIYIITDLEGISGVFKFDQTRETDTPLARQAREYFMGDVAAVVRGLRDGGATEVLVLDGHGNQAVIPHLAEAGARYITGLPRPDVLSGLNSSFAGIVLLGYHAMMGTSNAVLHHTQSSKSENRYWYNGVESGELAQCAAIAGHFGVPPILVTGDEATCREAERFFGTNCVTVAVKRGIAREAAVLYPFSETRKALYRGAKKSMQAIPRCKPYRLEWPAKAKKQFLSFQNANPPTLVIREATIPDGLHILDF
jgi:D-amino peptidase